MAGFWAHKEHFLTYYKNRRASVKNSGAKEKVNKQKETPTIAIATFNT